MEGAPLLHPEAELGDEGVVFDRMVESQPGHHQDIAVAAIEGVGQIGRQAVELAPGGDVAEAAVRMLGSHHFRHISEHRAFQHVSWFEAFVIDAFDEAEGLGVKQYADRLGGAAETGDDLRIAAGDSGMQAVDFP